MTARPYQVFLLPEAKRDLRKIWFDISVENVAAADLMIDKFDHRFASLVEFPERGSPRNELIKGLRVLIEGKYLVFYRVEAIKVEILRVVHGSRDLTALFK
jgi:toxin ParE1/3/4